MNSTIDNQLFYLNEDYHKLILANTPMNPYSFNELNVLKMNLHPQSNKQTLSNDCSKNIRGIPERLDDDNMTESDRNGIEAISKREGKWTKEEDELLETLVNKFGAKNWKCISEKMNGRSPIQCLHRWTKILQPGLVKGPWTVKEDKKLIEWVKTEGPSKWTQCAEFIEGRSGKQCRERWFNVLNPQVKKGGWDVDEDYKIFRFFNKYGGKWSKIVQFFEGRTENSIKNRFYSTLRRYHTEKKKLTGGVIAEAKTNKDLLQFVNEVQVDITLKFMKQRGFTSQEDLERFDSTLEDVPQTNANTYTYTDNLSVRKDDRSGISSMEQTMANIASSKNLNETINLNVNIKNNSNLNNDYNRFKSMDLKDLEYGIMNMNDENLFVQDDLLKGLENDIDKYVNQLFETHKIESNNESSFCDYCNDKDSLLKNVGLNEKVTSTPSQTQSKESSEQKEVYENLLQQLNDLEGLIKDTKSELKKYDYDDNDFLFYNQFESNQFESHQHMDLDPCVNVDTLFKF